MEQVYIGTTSYGRHWLDAPAAASWGRMVAAGCPAGGVTDAGRTHAEQVDVFLRYFTPDFASSAKHDMRVWQGRAYWRRPGRPSAATPGSPQARHTFGRALDLNGSTKAWVRTHGAAFGWVKDLVRGEDWHMEYQPARDTRAGVGQVSNPTPVPSGPNIPVVTSPVPGVVAELEKNMSGARVRREDGAVFYARLDGQGGSFRKLDPTANLAVDRLGVGIASDKLSVREVQEIRQAVIDLSKPVIDPA